MDGASAQTADTAGLLEAINLFALPLNDWKTGNRK